MSDELTPGDPHPRPFEARPISAASTNFVMPPPLLEPSEQPVVIAPSLYPHVQMPWYSAIADLLIIVGTFIILHWLIDIASRKLVGERMTFIQNVLISNGSLGIVMLSMIALLLRLRRQGPALIGLRWIGFFKTIGLAILAVPACQISAILMVMLYMLITGRTADAMLTQRTDFAEQIPVLPFKFVIPFCLFVGIHEEVLFRGFVLGRLRAIIRSNIPTIVLSSVVFGALHGYQGDIGVVQTGTIGLVLSIFAWRARSIWPCILAHAMIDTIGLSLAPHLADLLKELTSTSAPAGS